MTRRACINFLCAFLLLVAQHGALTHALWHAGHAHDAHQSYAHDQADSYRGKGKIPSGQSSLCPFDMAFGQVLGGTHGVCAPLAFVPAVVERIHDLTTPRLHAEALSPRSRGPPVLL